MVASEDPSGHVASVGTGSDSGVGHFIDRLFVAADRALAPRQVWLAAILLVVGGQAGLIVTHSAWPDEWQALLIALQSPDWRHLVENLRYEGHAPLWYLLLIAIAGIGVPAGAVLATSQLLVAGATKLLLFALCPLRRVERLLLSVSYLLLFEYGVIARGYGLGVLLVLAFLAARPRRVSWLPLALLPLVDFHFGLLSLFGLAVQRSERRWWWPGFGSWLAAAILAAWCVLPPADLVPGGREAHAFLPALRASVTVLGSLLFHLSIAEGQYFWEGVLPLGLGPIAGAVYLWLANDAARRDRRQQIAFWLFMAILVGFGAAVYDLSTRVSGLATILLVGILWRDGDRGKEPRASFRLLLALNAVAGLIAAGVAAVHPFDRAPAVAAWLRASGADRGLIASYPAMHGTSVAAHLGTDIYALGKDCRQSFVRWDRRDSIGSPSRFVAELRAAALHYGPFTLLVRGDLERDLGRWSDPRLLRFEARFDAGMDGRRYYVYRVGEGLPPTGHTPPRCRPTQVLPMPKIG